MNATTQTHPAESPEFLSRLQDGELSPPEAASFEEHRRGCARCREAADSYARALSIFRSAAPRPAASDLSARILRKVRAQAPSRRPFGVTFGIDVRWAGVCAAALVVVIMAASILDEGPGPSIVLSPPPSEPLSVRAHLLEKESAPADKADRKARRAEASPAPSRPGAARSAPPAASEEIGQRRDALAAAAPSNLARQAPAPPSGAPQTSAAYAPAPPAVAVQGEAPLVDSSASAESRDHPDGVNAASPPTALKESDRAAANVAAETARSKVAQQAPPYPAGPARDEQKTAALAAPSSRARPDTAPGGEADGSGPVGDGVRVIVESADGLGGAPALQPVADDAALFPFRGREFVLVVESGGRVRSAAVWGESGTLRDLRENAKAKDERESLSPFLELRFAPGERPRRLRVRIE